MTTPPLRTANLSKAPQHPPHKPKPPTLLHELISHKDWPAAIAACQSNPHHAGIGSGPEFRDERGYTALHSLLAYNRDARGEDLVPLVNAILKGAEEVDFGGNYRLNSVGGANSAATGNVELRADDVNTNTVVIDEDKSEGRQCTQQSSASRITGGSWRLLQDQSNRAQWSPLHLMCVQGGIALGGLPLLKSLLQIQPNCKQSFERKRENIEHRNHSLSLLDRQNRNVLHHLLEIVVPSRKSFELAPYILELNPSLAFQRDSHDKIPLMYVFDRITESPGTRRRHFMESYGYDDAGLRKNYDMLKLLIGLMSLTENSKTTGRNREISTNIDHAGDAEDDTYSESAERNIVDKTSMNVLHAACRLPPFCTNGKIIQFLLSPKVTSLENDTNLSEERDDEGNFALHIFLSNASNLRDKNNEDNALFNAAVQLYKKYPAAISIPNYIDQLPFNIVTETMIKRSKVGISILSYLIIQYPEAVLLDPSLENIKLLVSVFGAVTENAGHRGNASDGNALASSLTAVYKLLRARPDIASFGGRLKQSTRPETRGVQNNVNLIKNSNGGNEKEKKWWRKMIPFL